MSLVLSILTVLSAFIHIQLERKNWIKATFISKPLVMLFIIAIAYFKVQTSTTYYGLLVLIGLLFSLAGDIFLVFPKEKFVPGLVSFLIAHIFYGAAFFPYTAVPPTYFFITLLLIVITILPYLWSSLGSLKKPVLIYILFILMMLTLGVGMLFHTNPRPLSMLAASGAILFVFSDICLAIRKFRPPLKEGTILIMGSYYLAQLLIALSI